MRISIEIELDSEELEVMADHQVRLASIIMPSFLQPAAPERRTSETIVRVGDPGPTPAPEVAPPEPAPVDLAACRDELADLVRRARAEPFAAGESPTARAVDIFIQLEDQSWANIDAYVKECGSLRKALLAVWTVDGVAVSEDKHRLDKRDSEQMASTVLMTLFALGKAVPHYWARMPETLNEIDLNSIGGPRGG